ncbi:MAG: murein biosynthesis integral membrane protein MurJ [Acidobacteria bacterium]|nr:murein biosynthesis integral membrane protein MurJ [Acidobacteriota bacterium]
MVREAENCGDGSTGGLAGGDESAATGMVRHASRMVAVTLLSRVTGYIRDKTLSYVLGAGVVYDAFITATRIPSTFRALLGEGALHAAFIPSLAQLRASGAEARKARELVQGVLAALLLILSLVVAGGILASPLLVELFAPGFAATPGKMPLTILLNRLVFPYLILVSLAALCQGVLNSHDRFVLPAAAPILYNLSVAGVAWGFVRHSATPVYWLAGAVLLGGFLQFAVQARSVRRLGYSLRPAWRAATSPEVKKVLLLMIPGIPMLGIYQLNQLVSNFFASLTGDGGVVYTFAAYRITELAFGTVVVQLTTVLLPTLSRHLAEDTGQAGETLRQTISLVSFVTIPAAAVMAFMSRPIVGLLFGGGRFDAHDVTVTGATLGAYAFGLIGIGHAKVMANAFFAHRDTKTPMWGSVVLLLAFTAGCALMAGPWGTPGIGLANTIAMLGYATFLTVLYAHRHGLGRWGSLVAAAARQGAAAAALAGVVILLRPLTAPVETTGLDGALRVAAVLVAGGSAYLVAGWALGGRELRVLRRAMASRGGAGS